ncbi:MAG TPA: (Fe-S)-binding protein [Rhodanobacteraceae bacterium]|nr:(Fe-S)-binding protein [Rhodanobacteraceae bacterium]
MSETARPAVVAELLALADQCVMCGLCLPHCPTYRLTRHEAESPRGRIAIARSLASGKLVPTPLALEHLDRCLACLSCEPVCPSQVQYGAIIVRSRADLARSRPSSGVLRRLLDKPAVLVALGRIAVTLRAHRWLPGVARLLPRHSLLRRIATTLPVPPTLSRRSVPAAAAAPRGRVALFRGCVASVYDRDTHQAARRLLEALGHEVAIPDGTPCCGALALHAGDSAAFARQGARTARAVAATGASAVLVSASGCFGSLRAALTGSGGVDVVDIHEFLARDSALDVLRFRPLAATAALHLPCTQSNVAGGGAAIAALLARIPGLTVLALPEQPKCCGAAGSYFLRYADSADRLRGEKLDQARALRPDLLLTSNIGCRIHLANGLRGRSPPLPVLHPLALLAQQLEDGGMAKSQVDRLAQPRPS